MYLWLDLWDKRCGIAVEQAGIVFPKETVLRPKLLQTIKKYIFEYKITTIVVWLPYDLYGKQVKQLEKTQEYMKYLEEQFPEIKVEGSDERFSSFQADSIMMEMGEHEKRDDIAAAVILETYLEQKR